MPDAESVGSGPLVIISCSGCERRYLLENAVIPAETLVDGDVMDPDDERKRCPYCGTHTTASVRLGVSIERDDDGDDRSSA